MTETTTLDIKGEASDEPAFEPMALIAQFNNAYGVKAFIEQDAYGREQSIQLRMRLIREEFREVMDELLDLVNGDGDLSRLAKEIADLHYVLYGTEALFEIPSYAVFREVHRSNMSKLGLDGNPIINSHGKILKGPNYSPADVKSIIHGVSD